MPDRLPAVCSALARKLQLYGCDSSRAAALARRLRDNLAVVVASMPLYIGAAYVRSCFGGWPLPARFGQAAGPCHFCMTTGGDRITHIIVCPAVRTWLHTHMGAAVGDRYRGTVTRFLGVWRSLDPAEVRRLAWVHAVVFDAWLLRHHGVTTIPAAVLVPSRARVLGIKSPLCRDIARSTGHLRATAAGKCAVVVPTSAFRWLAH